MEQLWGAIAPCSELDGKTSHLLRRFGDIPMNGNCGNVQSMVRQYGPTPSATGVAILPVPRTPGHPGRKLFMDEWLG